MALVRQCRPSDQSDLTSKIGKTRLRRRHTVARCSGPNGLRPHLLPPWHCSLWWQLLSLGRPLRVRDPDQGTEWKRHFVRSISTTFQCNLDLLVRVSERTSRLGKYSVHGHGAGFEFRSVSLKNGFTWIHLQVAGVVLFEPCWRVYTANVHVWPRVTPTPASQRRCLRRPRGGGHGRVGFRMFRWFPKEAKLLRSAPSFLRVPE